MGMIDNVRSEMVAAMKNKDKERKEALSALLSALKNVAIDKRADLTDAEEATVVLKEIKQIHDTLEQTPADRTDIIEQCNFRIKVYEEFAPKMMSEDEIKEQVSAVIAELGIDEPKASDKGKIMKLLMPKVKGKADGSLVSKVVGDFLN